MGQKVNPHGMRVGVIKDWDSRWFTSKQAFGDTLVEDYKIRKTLKRQLYAAGVPKIEIERTVDSQTGAPRVKVNVFCAKPGIVIGKGGAESAKIEKQLAKLTGKTIIPFATSGGSDIGKTNERLAPSCKGAKLMDGKVFKGSVGHQELAAWVEGLGL